MLAASHRMRRAADFSAALHGRRAGSRCLVVALDQPADAADPVAASGRPGRSPMVGFIVSRAIGGATTRNLVRRRLRHAVAPHVPDLAPGSRLVVRALPASATASYGDLVHDLRATLARVHRPSTGSRGST